MHRIDVRELKVIIKHVVQHAVLVFLFFFIYFAYHDEFYPSKSQILVVAVRPTPKMPLCGPSLAFDLKSKKCVKNFAPSAGKWGGKEMDLSENKVTTQIKGARKEELLVLDPTSDTGWHPHASFWFTVFEKNIVEKHFSRGIHHFD